MVERLADQPFTLLGVNADEMSRSALKKRLAEAGVTWPQIMDGGKHEIAWRWNVLYYPRMFIIDQQGVIRVRASLLKPDEIERKVRELLAPSPATSQPAPRD